MRLRSIALIVSAGLPEARAVNLPGDLTRRGSLVVAHLRRSDSSSERTAAALGVKILT
jgi:hypothetical protein